MLCITIFLHGKHIFEHGKFRFWNNSKHASLFGLIIVEVDQYIFTNIEDRYSYSANLIIFRPILYGHENYIHKHLKALIQWDDTAVSHPSPDLFKPVWQL